jgi:rRNA processing protein Gar1
VVQSSFVLKRHLQWEDTEKTPPVGRQTIVMDKKAQEVGTIIDVFGPVKFPYVAIKPNRGYDPQKLVGQMLYLYKKQ